MFFETFKIFRYFTIIFIASSLASCLPIGTEDPIIEGYCTKPSLTMFVTYYDTNQVFDDKLGRFVEEDIEREATLCATLFPSVAPKTTNRIATLAQEGFYDNMFFHRVVEGFVVQLGHPDCQTEFSDDKMPGRCGSAGDRGSGYGNLASESFNAGFSSKLFKVGSLSMALTGANDPEGDNCGTMEEDGGVYQANSADSQFFICTGDCAHLNRCFTIFGELKGGLTYLNRVEQNKSKMTRIVYEP